MKRIFIILCLLYAGNVYTMESARFEQTKNMLSEGNLPAGSISALKKALPHMSLEQIEKLEEITTTQLSTCSDDKKERYRSIDANLKLACLKIISSHK